MSEFEGQIARGGIADLRARATREAGDAGTIEAEMIKRLDRAGGDLARLHTRATSAESALKKANARLDLRSRLLKRLLQALGHVGDPFPADYERGDGVTVGPKIIAAIKAARKEIGR